MRETWTASYTLPTGDGAGNPGLCLDQKRTCDFLVHWTKLIQLSHTARAILNDIDDACVRIQRCAEVGPDDLEQRSVPSVALWL